MLPADIACHFFQKLFQLGYFSALVFRPQAAQQNYDPKSKGFRRCLWLTHNHPGGGAGGPGGGGGGGTGAVGPVPVSVSVPVSTKLK